MMLPSFNRKSLRLADFDYSSEGIYFITIVTQERKCLFGSIMDGVMILNNPGLMVEQVCKEILQYIPSIELSPYQIMPNHFHALIHIKQYINNSYSNPKSLDKIDAQHRQPNVGADLRVCPGQPRSKSASRRVAPTEDLVSLHNIIQRFKSLTTRRYINGVYNHEWTRFNLRLWQRNYYEHVIRDESDYQNLAEYIINNPRIWEKDKEYQ